MVLIPLRYALFAAIATLVNLGSQALALHVYRGPFALTCAMACGTGTGLLTKYVLDKHWIFFDRAGGLASHSRKFSLYTATGIFTTAIFWLAEYASDALTPDGRYRFIGAVLGLTAGYTIKYRLDRRFVFSQVSA